MNSITIIVFLYTIARHIIITVDLKSIFIKKLYRNNIFRTFIGIITLFLSLQIYLSVRMETTAVKQRTHLRQDSFLCYTPLRSLIKNSFVKPAPYVVELSLVIQYLPHTMSSEHSESIGNRLNQRQISRDQYQFVSTNTIHAYVQWCHVIK